MHYPLLLITTIATLAVSKALNSSVLGLPTENLTLSLNHSMSSVPWHRVPWRYRVQRDLYIVFTSYLDPVDPDDYNSVLSSFREIIDSVTFGGAFADPMEFHKAPFGALEVDLFPYKDNPPTSRYTLLVILEAVGAIMNTRSPKVFRSRIEVGGLKRASFSIDWYQPVPHVAVGVSEE